MVETGDVTCFLYELGTETSDELAVALSAEGNSICRLGVTVAKLFREKFFDRNLYAKHYMLCEISYAEAAASEDLDYPVRSIAQQRTGF